MKLQNYPNEFRVLKTSCYWIDAGYRCLAYLHEDIWLPSEVWPGDYTEVTELELLVMTGTSKEGVLKDVIPIIELADNVFEIKQLMELAEAVRTGVQERFITSTSCGSCPPTATRII